MRNSLNIKLFIFFLGVSASCIAQNDTVDDGFALNAFIGSSIFQQGYGTPRTLVEPVIGVGVSIFLRKVAVEIGGRYYYKIFEGIKYDSDPSYSKLNMTQHFINLYSNINVKLFQKNRHILSLTTGILTTINLNCQIDTTMSNGSHRINTNATPGRAFGISLYLGTRYSILATRKSICYLEPYFAFKFQGEFYEQYNAQGNPSPVKYYNPSTDFCSFGLNIGFQWLASKNTPRYFVRNMRRKKNN